MSNHSLLHARGWNQQLGTIIITAQRSGEIMSCDHKLGKETKILLVSNLQVFCFFGVDLDAISSLIIPPSPDSLRVVASFMRRLRVELDHPEKSKVHIKSPKKVHSDCWRRIRN